MTRYEWFICRCGAEVCRLVKYEGEGSRVVGVFSRAKRGGSLVRHVCFRPLARGGR